MTGIPSIIRSDCGSQFTCQLTQHFLAMLGCSPRFNVPGRPQQSGLCERLIGTLKNAISKVAMDHPKSWAKHLGYVLWALRECPHETTGLPPWVLVYSKLPRGPLAVLKENWSGQRDLPLNLGKSTVEYLEDLRKNLEAAEACAKSHSQKAQRRYVSNYNLRSREKSFQVGEQVLILTPDSTARKVFSRWVGPATVIEVKSAHSYLVEINGARKHVHADKLRKYHVCVNKVVCQPSSWSVANVNVEVKQCAIVYDRTKISGTTDVASQ